MLSEVWTLASCLNSNNLSRNRKPQVFHLPRVLSFPFLDQGFSSPRPPLSLSPTSLFSIFIIHPKESEAFTSSRFHWRFVSLFILVSCLPLPFSILSFLSTPSESYFSSSSSKARAHGLDPSTSSKESNQILSHIALFFGSLKMSRNIRVMTLRSLKKKEFNFYIFRKYVPAVRSNLTKFMFNLSEWCQVILSLKGKCTGETLVWFSEKKVHSHITLNVSSFYQAFCVILLRKRKIVEHPSSSLMLRLSHPVPQLIQLIHDAILFSDWSTSETF